MSVLDVMIYPASVLRKKARPVKRFDEHVRRLVADMFETMSEKGGIGLAAPQVGRSKRIIVIDTNEPGGRLALANPKIVWFGKDREPFKEGCLSLPGVDGYVARPTRVRVRAQRPSDGEWFTLDADGLLARVLQHEIDHLDGVLFIDRLMEEERLAVEPLLREMEAA
jgi:peptide deformylase